MDQPQLEPAPSPALTPMMAQFFEIKAVNPGYLLFYRMGDFYELFFEDAEIASQALGIVLTKRGKHLENDIPMCGVPVHAAQDYLKKLISLGHRVAICEQMEDPAEAKKRGAKSVVKRDVVRLVTPGTLTEEDLLPAKTNNFLASLALIPHEDIECALAWADISTGETFVQSLKKSAINDELSRIAPAELIAADATLLTLGLDAASSGLEMHITPLGADHFNSEHAQHHLNTSFPELESEGFSRVARAALGGLLAYIAQTQKTGPVYLRAPQREANGGLMVIDAATRNSLELLRTNRGDVRGALRDAIDITVTAAGSRLLARRLSAPLADAERINARLDMVQTLLENTIVTTRLRHALKSLPDMSRALTRLALHRGGPRDVLSIGNAINHARDLGADLARLPDMAEGLGALATHLVALPETMAAELIAAIVEEPPHLAKDGGFINPGYDPALDKERALASDARTVIASLQARLAEQTDIKSLRIKHNNVLGYFIEVSSAHGSKLMQPPLQEAFIHRQTMASAMRFTTPELAELDGHIARARVAALDIELDIFTSLTEAILTHTDHLRMAADALAELDLTAALAALAAEQNYCRPQIDHSNAFAIKDGRHPVVEKSLGRANQSFVSNDCDLSNSCLWLVTGPNMGGKSTFLRQNAVIAIMAQMGAYVPASLAHIGIVDQVFSRVGAADDIAQGRSTFMVEMVETATILNRATERSLVILDEIGRGTSTFDGLSIAWATAEALHEVNASRALFATHFHELTALSKKLARVSNHTMKVREWEGDVVFLHEVANGVADRSYGIQVARLAGLPETVLERASAVLHQLEDSSSGRKSPMLDDIPLFAARPTPQKPKSDVVGLKLDQIRPDELTPRAAIDLIYELKKARDASRD